MRFETHVADARSLGAFNVKCRSLKFIRKAVGTYSVQWLSFVLLFATPSPPPPPWTAVHQALPSMEFSRQEYWSGLPFPSPGDLPDSGIESRSPALRADALPSEPPGNRITLNKKQLPEVSMRAELGHTFQGTYCLVESSRAPDLAIVKCVPLQDVTLNRKSSDQNLTLSGWR